ncbi:MAG: oligosaccharide flippase family protein [Bacteroidaceae bacterium]
MLKYTGLFGGVQGLSIFCSILRNKCVAVLIGSAGMGLIDLYNRVIDLLSNATNCGISFSAVRTLAHLHENSDRTALENYIKLVRSWSLLTALFGTLVCLLFSPIISYLTFGNLHYTLTFCMLSPIVGTLALSGGEIAIFKGVRELKKLALVSVFGAFSTLSFTVPFYLLLGLKGIVPALVLSTIALLFIQIYYSSKIYPWKFALPTKAQLLEGRSMLKLGIFYVLAGVIGAGAEVLVRRFLNTTGSIEDVGLYAAGFTLSITYARLIFVAMDADYYPRLSAAAIEPQKMNQIINSQIEVCILLMAPFLIVFMLALPYIIHIIYAPEFLATIPMVLYASFYMYFKAITSPIAYIALAKGDSFTYFSMEALYYSVFILLVSGGYYLNGLVGAGIALSLSNLFDLILISTVYHFRYHFRLSTHALSLIIVQGVLLAITLTATLQPHLLFRYSIGIIMAAISIYISIRIFRRETSLASSLKGFIRTQMIEKQAKK